MEMNQENKEEIEKILMKSGVIANSKPQHLHPAFLGSNLRVHNNSNDSQLSSSASSRKIPVSSRNCNRCENFSNSSLKDISIDWNYKRKRDRLNLSPFESKFKSNKRKGKKVK